MQVPSVLETGTCGIEQNPVQKKVGLTHHLRNLGCGGGRLGFESVEEGSEDPQQQNGLQPLSTMGFEPRESQFQLGQIFLRDFPLETQ